MLKKYVNQQFISKTYPKLLTDKHLHKKQNFGKLLSQLRVKIKINK